MTRLQNLFFQMKYCEFQQNTYQRYRADIESILDKE